MFIKEVPFATLRKTYTEVRDFVIDKTGVERNEVGLYSAIDLDLGCYDDDLYHFTDEFMAEFVVQVNTEVKPRTWLGFLSMILFSIVLIFFVILCLIPIIACILVLLIGSVFSSKYAETTIKIPSKKAWQASKERQSELCVGDLVCMALEKKEIRKQDIHYILPAQL